jgi:hypothetical protein
MKYNLFIISLLFFLGLASSTTCAQKLYVREKSGLQTDYSLTGIQKMTFTPGMLHVVKTGGNADEYPIGMIRFLSFSDIIIRIDEPTTGDAAISFRIFPNPAGGSFKIAATGNEPLSGKIELINLCGCVVKSLAANGERELEVDPGGICKGIYLCRLTDGNKVETLTFMKQ